jgi:hypothetical protein
MLSFRFTDFKLHFLVFGSTTVADMTIDAIIIFSMLTLLFELLCLFEILLSYCYIPFPYFPYQGELRKLCCQITHYHFCVSLSVIKYLTTKRFVPVVCYYCHSYFLVCD